MGDVDPADDSDRCIARLVRHSAKASDASHRAPRTEPKVVKHMNNNNANNNNNNG